MIRAFDRLAAAAGTPSSVWSHLADHVLAATQASRSLIVCRGADHQFAVAAARGLSPAFRAWVESGLGGLKDFWPSTTRSILNVLAEPGFELARSQFLAEGVRGALIVPLGDLAGQPYIMILFYDRSTPENAGTVAAAEVLGRLAAAHAMRSRAERDNASLLKLAEDLGTQPFECVRGEQWILRNIGQGFADLVGHPRQDLESGRVGVRNLKSAADIDRAIFELSRSIASGSDRIAITYDIIRGDGSHVAVQETSRIVESDSRGPVRIVGVLSPVQAGEGPSATVDEADVETIFHRFPMATCDLDPSGKVLRANTAFTTMLGLTPGSLDGAALDTLIHPDDLPRHAALLAHAFEGPGAAIREIQRWRRRDGSFLSALVCGCTTVPRGGGAPLLRCVVNDREDATVVQEGLKASESRLREIVEQTAVGIAEIGLDGKFANVNPTLCELLGYSQRDLIGMDWRKVSAEADVARCETKIAELAVGGPSSFSLEKRYIRRDGSMLWAVVTITALRGPDGALRRLVAVLQDITGRVIAGNPAPTTDFAKQAVSRVLIVDDEPAVRTTLCAMLEQDGFEAVTATGVHDATATLARERPFDVVVCDVGLRDGDGLEFARSLAASNPPYRIILMSGAPHPEAATLPTILRKPFGVEEFTRAVLTDAGLTAARSS